MARWYRRKRGGKFIGSALLPLGKGRTVNLKTADARVADLRAVAAQAAFAKGVTGQKALEASWSAAAAATATVRALDPAKAPAARAAAERARPPAPVDPEMDEGDDEADESDDAAGADFLASQENAQPAPAAAAPEPLHVAAAAAAAETTGAAPVGDVLDPKQKREAQARDEIAKCLAELGAEGDALGEQLFDLAAAAILWFEGWAISKGINWRLKKAGKTAFVEAAPGDEKALARRLLRIGLKAEVIERYPWLLDALTPKMAILVGLALGAANAAQSLQPLGTTEAAAKNSQPRPRPAPAASPASEPQTASA